MKSKHTLALLHGHVDPGVVNDITLYVPLVTGVLSVLLAEASAKKLAAIVAQDMLMTGILAALSAAQPAATAAPRTPTPPAT